MLFLEKQGATMHEQGGREVFFFLFFILILFCLCKRLLRLSCELVHLETIAWVQARCLFWVPLQAGVAWSHLSRAAKTLPCPLEGQRAGTAQQLKGKMI